MSSVVLLYVTFPSSEAALAIGRKLISQKLAACINVLPAGTSLYEWQGAIETSAETSMIVKTSQARVAAAQACIVAAHPYECPCVLRLPAEGGHPDFLAWIEAQTMAAGSDRQPY